MILLTPKGQRVMRPEFGCQIHDLLFAPNDATTAGLATYYVEEALAMWEPRIRVLEVDAAPDALDPARLLIDIRYEILATYDQRSLVFPFYRIPGDPEGPALTRLSPTPHAHGRASMPLPTPMLDDRKFQDIVDQAKRLIPRYCPEWTDHNVSDPGVALIELFAWMTDLLLYRVNQVPDKMYVRFLEMIGVQLRAPRAATRPGDLLPLRPADPGGDDPPGHRGGHPAHGEQPGHRLHHRGPPGDPAPHGDRRLHPLRGGRRGRPLDPARPA